MQDIMLQDAGADTGLFDMNAAPIRIGTVALNVRDLTKVSDFYQQVLGLSQISDDGHVAVLGAGDVPLLELRGDKALRPLDPRQAGLFHTAFLLPDRAALGRWLSHMASRQHPITGASDHIVSEAVYLNDPEGNGIEVYADRPEALWRTPSGKVEMSTDPMDVQGVLNAGRGVAFDGVAQGTIIGHVHLQVGATDMADGFYRDRLGFTKAATYPGASFYGSGGYHHQLAGNIWNSRNAGPRPENMTGLASVELVLRDAAARTALLADARSDRALRDPWGTVLELSAAS